MPRGALDAAGAQAASAEAPQTGDTARASGRGWPTPPRAHRHGPGGGRLLTPTPPSPTTDEAGVAAIVALVGALFAALYLPARARAEPDALEPEVPEAVAA
jgi:predicted S18 family serine protease